jgi:diaminohydroxyphosphoribosylaminopyrimidine deaminase/5-amino-6-(5-phosphoribosylamino)uracil reductase
MSFPVEIKYMHRCLQLAKSAAGWVAPNPMVGAVLVNDGKMIGEGYHQQYGASHAEVNCFNSVQPADEHLIPISILYVSLEPCAHFGKTPPCADLIISKGIKKVVVGIRDPFAEVNGKGIEKLIAAGIDVVVGCLEEDCYELNKRFFCFHTQQRPYIILKWAQTADNFIGNISNDRLLITSDSTNKLVHQWRAEEAAILVGANTALKDDPQLTVRSVNGKQPVRLLIDKMLTVPQDRKLFDGSVRTIVFNTLEDKKAENLEYIKIDFSKNHIEQILNSCYRNNIQSILVEGGAATLNQFIIAGLWDEARAITNQDLKIETGIKSPSIVGKKVRSFEIENDLVTIIENQKH